VVAVDEPELGVDLGQRAADAGQVLLACPVRPHPEIPELQNQPPPFPGERAWDAPDHVERPVFVPMPVPGHQNAPRGVC
jgi:hypothetical protein